MIFNGGNSHHLRLAKHSIAQCRRFISKKYSDTLNLPKTAFPLSMKDGAVSKREINIQKICKVQELYGWQWAQGDRERVFTLHDGPPYANGDPHVGHALNKILKDITNRYKLLQGHRVHYIPGWDCHGMPIEQKVLEGRGDHMTLSPMEIRNRAKEFASKAIRRQMSAFRRWGVMADWKTGCYYTLDKHYEAQQLEVFFQMHQQGFIYQDYMPVYWSPSSRTALAEAELEYNESHVSTAVYVRFPVSRLPDSIASHLGCGAGVHLLVWTTTPWTLPANKAICYGPGIRYSFVKAGPSGDVYLISSEFAEKLSQLLGVELNILLTIGGKDLTDISYLHPLYGQKELPLLSANHVTVAKGTGLVHTAPAHGQEDFQVAVRHQLPVECMVDEDGVYDSEAGPHLAGKAVLTDGNEAVLALLRSDIVHQEAFTHSYPYDWRTKQPVILRASKQWFVNTDIIRKKALECLEDVKIIPRASESGMVSQLTQRTYWCISRQRAWGVPIPVFYEEGTDRILLSRALVDHLKGLVLLHGTDCWWTLPQQQLLPPSVIQQSGFDPASTFTRGRDILDIWFDSGVSWASVLKDCDNVADVYLEGLDQFGGWFQSSLLTSVAAHGTPPYRALVVHGFAVDEEGKKMSKSTGNVVDPSDVIDGNKEKGWPAYGADVLRWWAAQSGFDHKVHIGPSILRTCHEQVFRLRKSVRYLMGNLDGFNPATDAIPYSDLLIQDQFMLHLLHQLSSQITSAYEDFNYSKVLNLLEKFNSSQISAFYCHVTKDRMYCSTEEDIGRRSCQTVQSQLLTAVVKFLAPIMPHLADEVFQYHPLNDISDSAFKTLWFEAPLEWCRPDLAELLRAAFSVRDTFYETVESENPTQFEVVICAKSRLFSHIKKLQLEMTSSSSALTEVLQSSSTSVLSCPPLVIPDESQCVDGHYQVTSADGAQEEESYMLVVMPTMKFQCQRCRRYTAKHYMEPCSRCMDAMAQGYEH